MRSQVSLATSMAALLVAAPACRGCLVDGVTYEGAGGGASTSSTSTSDAAASSGSTTSTAGGGDGTTASSGGGGAGSSTGTGGTGAGDAGGGGTGAGGTGGGSTSTGAGGDGGSDGCPQGDDFDDGLGPCWQVINEDDAIATFADGVATLVPEEDTGWHGPDDGIFFFQEVTGDFTATLRVETTAAAGSYQLAGLLLRDPGPAPEEWIKSEVGRAQFVDTSVYVGVTVGGVTQVFYNDGDGGNESLLGVCRRGDLVYLGARQGGPWFLYGGGVPLDPATEDAVPQLPSTIQLGFQAGSQVDGAHLTARLDDFRLALGGAEDCLDALEALLP